MKICSIPGCGRKHHTKGYCGMHAQRFRRHQANTISRPPNGTAASVVSMALSQETDECILWPLALNSNGYADINVGKKTRRVHNHVCTLAHGPAPFPRADAAHSCGNKPCINKRHLRWLTRAGNEADKVDHGRSNRGERQGLHKLTAEEVIEIRRLAAAGNSSRQIARQYPVSARSIREIVSRKTWNWLGLEQPHVTFPLPAVEAV